MRDPMSHYNAPQDVRDLDHASINGPGAMQTGNYAAIVTLRPAHSTAETTADGVDAYLAGATAVAFPRGRTTPRSVWQPASYRLAKRLLDVTLACFLLVLLLPLIVLVVLAVRLEGPGPLVFAQVRCGRNGRPFRLYKFRSMVVQAEVIRVELDHLNESSGPMFKIRRDPRVTRVGAIMRKLSIDEVPQLINVLRGDMTLVGPRPSLPQEVATFTDFQRRRLEVKPGLTCLWQVSGRSDLSFDEWVELDVEYIRRQSFWLDIIILLRTIPAVLSGRGAY